ncbi:hypothetical protein J2T58_001133 [Methanocalculus alkaliphilus]|uniref:hypothetical protein n=1 Tax=Methanocalculus alkaliphilus TaxID=768730 RepID=UPI00209F654C|nr:hypothetical protein [Methanocalculus alkaliphilus]MCP1715279.1 hypothetical protein [Methanocalculus alkaliphilus]
MKNRYVKKFAELLPVVVIIIILTSLLFGGLILGRWDYSVRGLTVAVPSILASFLLIYIFKNPTNEDNNEYDLKLFRSSHLSYLLFTLLYILSIIVLLMGISRFIYLLLIFSLFLIIFLQIYSQLASSNTIIPEIILVMMNIIYGTTFAYPLFFRTTDLLYHNTYTTVTLLSGHTIPADLSPSYATFPLFHIYNAMSSAILGLSVQHTQFLVMCLVYVTVILFLYRIFLYLSESEQISLLACLCFSLLPIVLLEGIMMVTRTTAFVGFVILLYLIFTSKEKNPMIYKAFIFIFSIFIMLVHQVSIAQIAFLLALFMACEILLSEKKYFSTNQMLFITISFCTYWIFTSRVFLDWLVKSRTGLDYLDFGQVHTVIDPSLDQMQLAVMFVQNQIDISIFILFALVGIIYLLYRQKPQYLPVLAIFSLMVLIFYIPNPLLTSQTISRIYRIDRFALLIAPFMAFAMASGIFWLSKWTQKSAFSRIYHSMIIIIFSLFILLSLQQPILDITSDEGRLYFTEGELTGYNYANNKIPFGVELYSDYHTYRYFNLEYFSLTEKLDLPYYSSTMLRGMTWTPKDDQYVIFRNKKFEDMVIHLQTEDGMGRVNYISNNENMKDVNNFFNDNNVIYSNSHISYLTGRL